jgi:formate dehydrogenase subunit gamma
MNKGLPVALLLAQLAGSAMAQSKPPVVDAAVVAVTPSDASTIKNLNILDVKPDASTEPGYAVQSNGERSKVQPGNNAPM